MVQEFKEFYDALKETLESYNGNYSAFIDYGPMLYKLLSKLLMNYGEKLDSTDKLHISAAIAYYVVPLDVIPEQEYGPYGYIDDIYISVYVLREIIEKYGYDDVNKLWDEVDNLNDVLDECNEKSLVLLDDTDEILRYVGLID